MMTDLLCATINPLAQFALQKQVWLSVIRNICELVLITFVVINSPEVYF